MPEPEHALVREIVRLGELEGGTVELLGRVAVTSGLGGRPDVESGPDQPRRRASPHLLEVAVDPVSGGIARRELIELCPDQVDLVVEGSGLRSVQAAEQEPADGANREEMQQSPPTELRLSFAALEVAKGEPAAVRALAGWWSDSGDTIVAGHQALSSVKAAPGQSFMNPSMAALRPSGLRRGVGWPPTVTLMARRKAAPEEYPS